MIKKLLIIASAIASISSASAEVLPGTNLEVFVESAAMTGSGRTVSLRRMPVRNSVTGEVNWYDISFEMKSNGSDQIAFERISQIKVSPPVLSTSAYRAGLWKDTAGNVYAVTGPAVGTNGYENYTLTLRTATGDMKDVTVKWSTEPMASQFRGNSNYTTYKNLYDPKDLETSFGTLSFLVSPRSSHTFYWASRTFISVSTVGPDQLVFQSWSRGVAQVNTVLLSYIGPAGQ